MINKIFIYLDHIFVSIFVLFYSFFFQLDQVNISSIIQNKMKRTTESKRSGRENDKLEFRDFTFPSLFSSFHNTLLFNKYLKK